jgi:hypothetical protein
MLRSIRSTDPCSRGKMCSSLSTPVIFFVSTLNYVGKLHAYGRDIGPSSRDVKGTQEEIARHHGTSQIVAKISTSVPVRRDASPNRARTFNYSAIKRRAQSRREPGERGRIFRHCELLNKIARQFAVPKPTFCLINEPQHCNYLWGRGGFAKQKCCYRNKRNTVKPTMVRSCPSFPSFVGTI